MNDTPETLAWLKGFEDAGEVDATRHDGGRRSLDDTEVVSDYVQQGALGLAFEFDLAAAILDAASPGTEAKLAVHAGQCRDELPAQPVRHDDHQPRPGPRRERAAPGSGKLKLAAALLLTGPGVPFIYYGEEIGQIGAKPDESIRNPMPWSGDANGGFTQAAKPWERLQRGFETRNVAAKPATRRRCSVSIAS